MRREGSVASGGVLGHVTPALTELPVRWKDRIKIKNLLIEKQIYNILATRYEDFGWYRTSMVGSRVK